MNWLLRIIILGLMLVKVWTKSYSNLEILALTFVLTFYANVLEKGFHFQISPALNVSLSVFLFSAQVLGTVLGFYTKFLWWDIFLHTASGAIFYFAGKELLKHLGKEANTKVSLPMLVFFSVCFALSTGVVWEIFEFSADSLFGKNTQWARGLVGRAALMDTMTDLISLSVGVVVVTICDTLIERNTRKK